MLLTVKYVMHQPWERRSRSFLYNGNIIPVFFLLYTPIVNCNFVEPCRTTADAIQSTTVH